MTEILKAGEYVLRADIANWVIAICAFLALFTTGYIGRRQAKASEATVNRQIILKWVEDFRETVSSFSIYALSARLLLENRETENPKNFRTAFERFSTAKNRLLLLIDVEETSNQKFRGKIDVMSKIIIGDKKNLGELFPKIDTDITTLSKVIIEQKMVLVHAGELVPSKKSSSKMDIFFNSWPEEIESDKIKFDKEEGTQAG